ncbi:hypothetical protein PV371_05495 [Streptomyces sp. TX20-6-3]|uniref:hypothetical protein n=1 Tax=Streptomyces sp. TX20-6-3 TaxID=3028705 RepID=UPI0029B2B49B|nr:hypothetical protein [Streptomyces sp. TX20-6-3]MDX2559101.1 hypothetical protein [Streptomyces sp. TX20-6-3]
MQRPNAAQLTCGSATVVLATVALLLFSGTTTTLGITAISLAGLLLGLLVAVTMPLRTSGVKTVAPTPPPTAHEEVRVPTARVGAGVDTRTGS